MYEKLLNKKSSLAVIGLGYVGLPVALEFAKKIRVIGFDINQNRIQKLHLGQDPSSELSDKDFENTDILFTSNITDLVDVGFYIIAVPTPIDEYNQPDLSPLLAATKTVAQVLKKGDYVVFESTVYPGCTEEKCVPILEQQSGLVFKNDFKVGYSPERINPGDREHTLKNVIKVTSGCDTESANIVANVYELIVDAGVHRASSIKVAEASKVIENTQRDLNIALMNELSMIFDKLNINTYEVLEAAGTKWNFLKFFPGLVGGHCIGVDPYYLTFKAAHMGHFPKVILSGREINDSMGAYIAKKTLKTLIAQKIEILNSRILVMGGTFKENVADIRNSKVIDMVKELKSFNLNVDIIDPHASKEEFVHEYGLTLSENPTGLYDAIILAVAHKEYANKSESYFQQFANKNAIFIDLKGVYRNKISNFLYWSL